jgi:hypothetical protein
MMIVLLLEHHESPSYLVYFNIHFNTIFPSMTQSPKWPGFPTKILCAFLICPARVICPAHFVIFDLVTPIVFGEEYEVITICTALYSIYTLETTHVVAEELSALSTPKPQVILYTFLVFLIQATCPAHRVSVI